ncbi:hypothetical protein BV898_06099 [Hypsibius exemplaris]|uniref:Uncharacterized protein n=1 Tax=Hypsibius exemplaris TaxID=2072580 RepID=A0A1W0WX91_HYPEX|nr:hypothetical protein BV898_06099 [Hypsibius exemplaris]
MRVHKCSTFVTLASSLSFCLLLLPRSAVSKCLKLNRDYANPGPPRGSVDYLFANNYGKKPQRWTQASLASRVANQPDNDDTCPIGVEVLNSSIAELPVTTCSAIISTHIGDYIAYCALEPASKILTYELNCNRGAVASVIGRVPLVTETVKPVFHLESVDDMISDGIPRPLLIALSRNAFSSAYQIITEGNRFSLSPCHHVFEYKHLTKIATLPIRDVGTVIAFANNNLEQDAPHSKKLAPIYIARGGEISLCGLADVDHTTDVTLWYRGHHVMVTFIQKIGNSRRCLLRNFEINFGGDNRCQDVVPWKTQPTIGNTVYNGTTDPLALATEPFTIDHFLCGCETVKAVQNDTLTYLVVGLANSVSSNGDGLSCPDEEKISFNGSATDNTCGCPYAQDVSFVLPYDKTTRSFTYHNYYDPSTFQTLEDGPAEVTEITPLLLKDCCLAFQIASDRSGTQLYGMDLADVDGTEKPRVERFLDVDLPSHVEKTAWGYCSDDTIFLSYTRAGFITGDSMYKLQCKMDDFSSSYDFLRSGPLTFNNRSGNTYRLYRDRPPAQNDDTRGDWRKSNNRPQEFRENFVRPSSNVQVTSPDQYPTGRRLGGDNVDEQSETPFRPPIVYQMPIVTDAGFLITDRSVGTKLLPQQGRPFVNQGFIPPYPFTVPSSNPHPPPPPLSGSSLGTPGDRTGPLGPYG